MHSSDSPVFDPGYGSDVARWIRYAVYDRIGYDVVPDRTLTDRVLEIDDRHNEIKVRPGMGLRRFHAAIDRAVLYVVGGSLWAPEFSLQPYLRLVRDTPDPASN